MRKLTLFICLTVLLGLCAMTGFAQLTGTKTIGAGGDYTTFLAAITDLNANGVGSGGVIFRIKSETFTEASPLTIDITANKPTSSNPVTFKPEGGATVVLNVGGQVTGSRWAIKIGTATNTVDYVTLDGSNSDGGSTRDWTIKATAGTYGIETLDIYGDYVTVKNCIIDMNSSGYSGSGFGITYRDASPTATYGTVENCKVTGNNSISIGRGTAADMPGFVIKNNEAHCLNRGIYLYRSSNCLIESNEIIGDAYAGYPAGACYGIYTASPSGNTDTLTIRNNVVRNLGSNSGSAAAQTIRGIAPSGPGTYKVYGNKVYNLYNATTSTGNPIVYGIQLAGGGSTSSYSVYNNMVYGILNNDPDANASAFTYGIQYNTSGNANIYHNSVYIEETTRDHLCAAFAATAGNAANTVTLKNNIFYNSNTSSTYKSYAIYKSGSLLSTLVSDYNDLYVDGSTNAFVGFATSDQTTLANWQSATSLDANSINISPANPFGGSGQWTSSSNLHWLSKPSDNFKATPLGSPYNTDIDGDSRDALDPYMGADEIPGQPLPVQLVSFTTAVNRFSATLTWVTATEIDNYGFEIERRTLNGGAWAKVGFVEGAGNSTVTKTYAYTDYNLEPGEYAYRLRQLNKDGSSHYFGSAEVVIGASPKQFAMASNYPNPFNPTTTIEFSIPEKGRAVLKVYNIVGEEVATLFDDVVTEGTMYRVQFNASGLASGTYFYRLQYGKQQIVKKMLLAK